MTDEQTDPRRAATVERVARRLAQMDGGDNHTIEQRLDPPWQRYRWEAEQVIEAAAPVSPATTDHDALIAEAEEWIQSENWETDYEQDGSWRPGAALIQQLGTALAQSVADLAEARAERDAAIDSYTLAAMGRADYLDERNEARAERDEERTRIAAALIVIDLYATHVPVGLLRALLADETL